MIRQQRPDARIGFYLHIPFPPLELFSRLPWRAELLDGLLGADVVGVHTQVDARNVLYGLRRFCDVADLSFAGDVGVGRPGRQTSVVKSFRLSVDLEAIAEQVTTDEVELAVQ